MDEELVNPLDAWVSFPDAAVVSRQEMLPSESHGWGLNLVLALPRSIAHASVRTQMTMAGFDEETSGARDGLLRFIREDAYVWGSVSDASEGCHVLLSCTTGDTPERSEN